MDNGVQYPYPYPCMAGQRTAYPQSSVNTYSGGHSQATRPVGIPQATVGLDFNRDGRVDHLLMGPDYNHDGIPDVLQQGYTHPGHAEFEEEPLRVSMVVPEGALPGTKLQYTAPDGQELRLTVPDGVPPGSVMTLTQDPMSKAWKCMAEPAEPPAPATYEPPPQYTSNLKSYTASAPTATTERITKYVAGSPPVVTYQASTVSSMPRVIGSTMSTMPVNLSYVPPPVMPTSASLPSAHVTYGVPSPATYAAPPVTSYSYTPPRQDAYPGTVTYEQRPSYTPPPVMFEQRPSYTPPPVPFMESRPSYTPLPQGLPGLQGPPMVMDPTLMATTTKVHPMGLPMVIGQTPSYVPPPLTVLPNNPSYVPPVVLPTMQTTMAYDGGAATSVMVPPGAVIAQGPSITTLPSHQPPPVGQPYGHQYVQPYGQPPMGTMAGPPPPGHPGAPGPMNQFGQQMPPQMGLGPHSQMGIGLPPLGLQMGFQSMGAPHLGQPPMPMMGGLQPPAPLLGNFGSLLGPMPGQMGPGQLPSGQLPPGYPGQPQGQMPGQLQGQLPTQGQLPGGHGFAYGYGMYPGMQHGFEGPPQAGGQHQMMMGPPQQLQHQQQ